MFWCLRTLRDYELGNQLWSVQATISAKVAMSVYETFIHTAKSYKIIGSMRAQRSVMKQRLWVVTCILTAHQSVKILTKVVTTYDWTSNLSLILQSVLMCIIVGSDQSWTLIYHKMHAVSNTTWQTNEQYWAIASKKSRSRELGFKSEYNTRLLLESFAQGSSSCDSWRLLPVSIPSNSLVK